MSTHQSKAQDKMQYQWLAPTKIAYLLNTFPALSETFILEEILELERQGVPLHLFSLSEPPSSNFNKVAWGGQTPVTYISRYSRSALVRIAMRRFLKAPWRFLRTGILMLSHYRTHHRILSVLGYLLYSAYLADKLEQESITHLHAHFATESTSVAQAVHLFTGITYSFTAHAYDIYLSPKTELIYKISMARFVSTCSTYNQRYLAALVDQQLGERIRHINYGLNLRDLPSKAPTAFEQPGSPLILTVARLVEKKGLIYLVRACKVLKDQGYNFTCRIVGEGPLRPVLEQEIREYALNDRVELWGAETNERVIQMYQEATIVTLPCIISKNGDRDGLPLVLIEASYMGVPVVSTTVAGIPELITPEVNGLLVPPNDSIALAGALARLLEDPLLRCRLAVAGQQTIVSQFDLSRNAGQLLDLIRTN